MISSSFSIKLQHIMFFKYAINVFRNVESNWILFLKLANSVLPVVQIRQYKWNMFWPFVSITPKWSAMRPKIPSLFFPLFDQIIEQGITDFVEKLDNRHWINWCGFLFEIFNCLSIQFINYVYTCEFQNHWMAQIWRVYDDSYDIHFTFKNEFFNICLVLKLRGKWWRNVIFNEKNLLQQFFDNWIINDLTFENLFNRCWQIICCQFFDILLCIKWIFFFLIIKSFQVKIIIF